MRDDFEFQVYVTYELSSCKKDDGTKILYVDQAKQCPGVIKKEGDRIILELSTVLMKPESKNKSILSHNDEVYSQKDFSTLLNAGLQIIDNGDTLSVSGEGIYEKKSIIKNAGFRWDGQNRVWFMQKREAA